MKIPKLLLLLLHINIACLQQIHLFGTITDAQTNQPIAAATISISSKNLYFPADDHGKFDITNPEIADTDTVSFSCIGYQTKKIAVGSLSVSSEIKLRPMINMLQEVKVSNQQPLLVNAGSKAKTAGGTTAQLAGSESAIFMEGSKNIKGHIATVSFYLSNGGGTAKGGDFKAPFGIKVYAVANDGTPGQEITGDIIIASTKRNNAWFDADVSAYHIEVPDSGFFVAFCLLSPEYYKLRKGVQTNNEFGTNNSADTMAPRLGIATNEAGEARSYITIKRRNVPANWHLVNANNLGYLIRATIIRE